MKAYNAEYTWQEVKDATNRCLLVVYGRKDGDCVKDIFDDALPLAMNTVARQCFIYGKHIYSFHDLHLIKQAFMQQDRVGYIGTMEVSVKDNRKNEKVDNK